MSCMGGFGGDAVFTWTRGFCDDGYLIDASFFLPGGKETLAGCAEVSCVTFKSELFLFLKVGFHL